MASIRVEPLILSSFILGLLYGYLGYPGQIFGTISGIFIAIFYYSAPFIVFLLITLTGLREAIHGRVRLLEISGRMLLVILLFSYISGFIGILFSILIMGSIQLPDIGLFIHEALIIAPMLTLNPVIIALFTSILLPYILSGTAGKYSGVINLLYNWVMGFFKRILYIMPIISFSLGISLYQWVSVRSINLIMESILLIMLFGVTLLTTIGLGVSIKYRLPPGRIFKYVFKTLAYTLPLGGSLLALPVNIEVYREVFDGDDISVMALSTGAALNRCGSIGGAVIVLILTSRFIGYELSFTEVFIIGLLLPLISLGAPGLYGGTILVAIPLFTSVMGIGVGHPLIQASTSLFIGLTTYIQAAVNTASNGLVALILDRVFSRR